MARIAEVVRPLAAGALMLCWAGCAEDVAGSGDETLDVETVQSAVNYDGIPKPVPTAFLHLRTGGMRCCMGMSSSDPACAAKPPAERDCATGSGLVTQAGLNKTADYYMASGQSGLTTLDSFKAAFNIPQRIPNESMTDYRARAGVVIYYNVSELGLGRELGCGESGSGSTYKVGCYVTNYGDAFASIVDPNSNMNREFNYPTGEKTGLYNAVYGIQPKGTVVISYDGARPADHKVQFGAYDAAGNQTNKAQLDNMGARPVPEICTSCHGGMWDGDAQGNGGAFGLAKKARFLPLVTSMVVFPTTAEDSMAQYYEVQQQEPNIKRVNELAWKVRNEALTWRQQTILNSIYAPNPALQDCTRMQQTTCVQNSAICVWSGGTCKYKPVDGSGSLNFISGSGSRQKPEQIVASSLFWSNSNVAGTNLTQRELYRNVILRNCDTCHMAMDGQDGAPSMPYNDFTSWTNMNTTAAINRIKLFIGVNASGGYQPTQGSYLMPHSQNLNARFWSDSGWLDQNGLGSCRIGGVTKPAADCLIKAVGGTRPAPSVAIPSGAQAQSSADCGQTMGDAYTTSTAGYNSGRRRALANGQAICQAGCERSAVFCPGTEQNHKVSAGSGEFSGTRQECVLNPNSSTIGTCKSCGRLHQPICRNIGSQCDTALNPFCTSLPACHEGVIQGSAGAETCEDVQLSGATPIQWPDYDPNQWWIGWAGLAIDGYYWRDFAEGHASHTGWESYPYWQLWWPNGRVHISQIDIYPGADLEGFQNIGVYYWVNNPGYWEFVPGGNMTTSGQSVPFYWGTTFVLPAPVYTDNILIQSYGGPYVELAEVAVRGY